MSEIDTSAPRLRGGWIEDPEDPTSDCFDDDAEDANDTEPCHFNAGSDPETAEVLASFVQTVRLLLDWDILSCLSKQEN